MAERTVPSRKQPTVLNDIDTGVKVWNRLKTFCFTDMSIFSPDDRTRTK